MKARTAPLSVCLLNLGFTLVVKFLRFGTSLGDTLIRCPIVLVNVVKRPELPTLVNLVEALASIDDPTVSIDEVAGKLLVRLTIVVGLEVDAVILAPIVNPYGVAVLLASKVSGL